MTYGSCISQAISGTQYPLCLCRFYQCTVMIVKILGALTEFKKCRNYGWQWSWQILYVNEV